MKILIVDDDPEILEIIESSLLLIAPSAKIKTCLRARSGLINLDSDYSFVITDIVMPEMNGVQFGREVKDKYPEIPIIALSGAPSSTLEKMDIRNLFQDLIKKPFEIDDLRRALSEKIDNAS